MARCTDSHLDIYREMTDGFERFALHEINLRVHFIAHRDLFSVCESQVVASSLSYENGLPCTRIPRASELSPCRRNVAPVLTLLFSSLF